MSGIHPSAPSLREVQRRLAAQILAGEPDPSAALGRCLAVPPGRRIDERLAVYVDGYPARLHEALLEAFPAVAHMVGAARFHALVHRYQRRAALRSYNLNDAGSELAAVLRADPLGAELPFLPDLAAFEWAMVRAFHAVEAAPLAAADLVRLAPEAIVAGGVRFQPSLTLIESPWPIHALWSARETPHGEIDIDLTAGESVLVWRRDLEVTCLALDGERAAVLRALHDGAPLALAVEHAADPAAAIGWLGEWIAAGQVAACGG
jgi:hypothetical protein